jgi:putative ABC transport system permease protein
VSVWSTLWLAIRALARNKVRSALTMLGIVFGIGAVISIVAAGQGARESVREVFQALGTNLLIVTNGSQQSFGAAGGAGSRASLTWQDLEELKSGEISTIHWVAPVLTTKTQVAAESNNWNTTVTGTNELYFQIRNWRAVKGVVLDADTGQSDAKVAIIGQTVATQLYGTADPIGQLIRINAQPYEVVGLLTTKGQGPMGNDYDDTVVIPIKTYQAKIEKGLAKYIKGQLYVSLNQEDDATRTEALITALLRDRHKLGAADDDDFRIRNPAEFAQAQEASTGRITTLLFIVAIISLVVGGIGVMNIMLVSVTERTREIGVSAYGWKFFFPTSAALLAVAFSGGIGVLFGLYPAIRASRLDPITALRYES